MGQTKVNLISILVLPLLPFCRSTEKERTLSDRFQNERRFRFGSPSLRLLLPLEPESGEWD